MLERKLATCLPFADDSPTWRTSDCNNFYQHQHLSGETQHCTYHPANIRDALHSLNIGFQTLVCRLVYPTCVALPYVYTYTHILVIIVLA